MATAIYMQSPNGNFWTLNCTDQGALALTPSSNIPLRFLNPNLTIATVNWGFTPTNNGALQIVPITNAKYLLPYLVVQSTPSNILYQIKVNELGQLFSIANPSAVDFVPGVPQSFFQQRSVICYTAANQLGIVMADDSVWCSAVSTFVPWVETNAHQIVLSEIS